MELYTPAPLRHLSPPWWRYEVKKRHRSRAIENSIAVLKHGSDHLLVEILYMLSSERWVCDAERLFDA